MPVWVNKEEFIGRLREKGMLRREAETAVELMIETIIEAVCAGETIYFVGFGQFMPIEKPRKRGRNIKEGTDFWIEAHTEPFFKPEKRFREAVRNAGK